MNVVIIGTSNSLVKNGFKDGLINIHALEVFNLSIGGCCAVQHIERMLSHQKVLLEADIIILDSIVNDLIFSMTGEAEQTFIIESITAMYEMAVSMNKPVFSVLFPTKHHLSAIDDNAIYLHHLSECKRLSIGTVDLFNICKGMKYKTLGFLDGPHISPLFSRIVGESIGRFCLNENNFKQFDKSNYQPLVKLVGRYTYSVRNLVAESNNLPSERFVEKRNRQFSERLINLEEALCIDIEGSEVMGILQWSDKNSGAIKLLSESSIELPSSNGLLRFSILKSPMKVTSSLAIEVAGILSDKHNILIKTILLRKEGVEGMRATHRSSFDTTLLDLQIRQKFAVFMQGIEHTINKLSSLAATLDDSKRSVVEEFLGETVKSV